MVLGEGVFVEDYFINMVVIIGENMILWCFVGFFVDDGVVVSYIYN